MKRGEAARFSPLPKGGEGSETFAAQIIDGFSSDPVYRSAALRDHATDRMAAPNVNGVESRPRIDEAFGVRWLLPFLRRLNRTEALNDGS